MLSARRPIVSGFALLCAAAPAPASALEATITLAFSGTGGCSVCGSTTFSCSSGSVRNWNGGNLPFTDPLPSGTWTVTAAAVEIHGALDCGSTGETLSASLNGESIGSGATVSSCDCGDCDTQPFAGSVTGAAYNFGGSNTVNLTASDDACVSSVDLTITYEGGGCDDDDGDGFEDDACGGNDCDDSDPNNYPGNTEVCDFADNDCDGSEDEGLDLDGDGYTPREGDCNEGSSQANPGIQENTSGRCDDGIDNDCDGDFDGNDSDCAPFQGDDDDGDASDDDDSSATGDDDDDGGRGRSSRTACGFSTVDAPLWPGLLAGTLIAGSAMRRRRRDGASGR